MKFILPESPITPNDSKCLWSGSWEYEITTCPCEIYSFSESFAKVEALKGFMQNSDPFHVDDEV